MSNRQGGGFGVVMLLVVVAIVLLLAAKAWNKTAPSALEVATPAGTMDVPDHGQTEAVGAVRSGGLPGINDARQATDAHAASVQQALDEVE